MRIGFVAKGGPRAEHRPAAIRPRPVSRQAAGPALRAIGGASSAAAMRASMARAGSPDRRAPIGAERGHEIGLRAQDHPSSRILERVGGERRAGGGDVDDQFRAARRRRALGRAEAFDDAIVADAVAGEKAARQIDVFGGDAHALAAARMKGRRDIFEVGHVAHVDPGLRRGDDDIGAAEAERGQQQQALGRRPAPVRAPDLRRSRRNARRRRPIGRRFRRPREKATSTAGRPAIAPR